MAKGINGQVNIVDDRVVITRKGFLANPAFNRGTLEIPIQSITSIELKEPSFLTGGGFLQILYAGCPAPLPPQQRAQDPNIVLFTKSSLPDFLELKNEIDHLRMKMHEPPHPVSVRKYSSGNTMYCKHCGKTIDADSIYCKYCGGEV